jgi:hypothetical protein
LWRATGRRAAAQGDGVIAEPQAVKSGWGRRFYFLYYSEEFEVGLLFCFIAFLGMQK